MVEMRATVKNAQGIHCRPSAVIVKALQGYSGRIRVRQGSDECDPRSIMSLLGMALQKGSELVIEVSGPEEDATCRRLVELFERQFDFAPRKPGEPLPIEVDESRIRDSR